MSLIRSASLSTSTLPGSALAICGYRRKASLDKSSGFMFNLCPIARPGNDDDVGDSGQLPQSLLEIVVLLRLRAVVPDEHYNAAAIIPHRVVETRIRRNLINDLLRPAC